jgi:hypothetical protein
MPAQPAKTDVNDNDGVIKVRISTAAIVLLAIGLPAAAANAQTSGDEVAELRQMIIEMRDDYERRISELEARLDSAEREARVAKRDADEAFELAEEAAIQQTASSSSPNTFNPAIGVVLDGGFADVGAGWEEIPGFQPAGEIGTGETGFSPGEVEINLKANIDTRYYGNVTFALASEDGEVEVEFEEAWVQTTALPAGFTLMGGRFFSEAGYLNDFHFHADDFVDRPLPYQAFYGGRYTVDGIQARWLAPTSLLFEIGTELNWAGSFPNTANAESSPGAYTFFTRLGGDVGDSNSWLVGLSHVSADAIDRVGGHEGEEEGGAFTGDSDLTVADFVWKWAPLGNPNVNNFKLQGEYFVRSEKGSFAGLPYDGDQEGWYVQGVWQFAPTWRVGLRHDMVDADNGPGLEGTELENPGRSSRRSSVMLDWSPSEFSRLRLQYTDDQVLEESDSVWYLQYIMSIGAHRAHQF